MHRRLGQEEGREGERLRSTRGHRGQLEAASLVLVAVWAHRATPLEGDSVLIKCPIDSKIPPQGTHP